MCYEGKAKQRKHKNIPTENIAETMRIKRKKKIAGHITRIERCQFWVHVQCTRVH